MQRSSGILLPITALSSPYGIGTLGQSAYQFIDFLAEAGQTWWQLLPVGPTSYGDSPYQSFSTYAGNPYLIDLDLLIDDGLLTKQEVLSLHWGDQPKQVDYAAIYQNRLAVLSLACSRGWTRYSSELRAFCDQHAQWLPDYVLFMALKRANGMRSWLEWSDRSLREHDEAALARARNAYADDIRLFTFIQFLFYRQWQALREYAHQNGVFLFGDLPIYVALDSADVWAEREQFQLDEHGFPTAVAGVPPDYFSETGQLWGNPLYNWQRMKQDGYNWWIRRMDGAGALYDKIRIDHFRGLARYWSIPSQAETAASGHWEDGPGLPFIQVLTGWFPNLGIVAEDLGVDSPEVRALLRDSSLPGMKVLQFAFQNRKSSPYRPHEYEENCICYCGTHDNDTVLGWAGTAPQAEVALAKEYLGMVPGESLAWGLIRGGMRSIASLFIACMQDYLELGSSARINTPGTLGGNWRWRLGSDDLTHALAFRIRQLTELYGRCAESTATRKKEP